VLERVAACCSVLQCVAVYGIMQTKHLAFCPVAEEHRKKMNLPLQLTLSIVAGTISQKSAP